MRFLVRGFRRPAEALTSHYLLRGGVDLSFELVLRLVLQAIAEGPGSVRITGAAGTAHVERLKSARSTVGGRADPLPAAAPHLHDLVHRRRAYRTRRATGETVRQRNPNRVFQLRLGGHPHRAHSGTYEPARGGARTPGLVPNTEGDQHRNRLRHRRSRRRRRRLRRSIWELFCHCRVSIGW